MCPTCRERVKLSTESECQTCARRRRYGAIVAAMFTYGDDEDIVADMLDGFDALAELMIERHHTLRAHQKELREADREAQRAARESYDEGRAESVDRW